MIAPWASSYTETLFAKIDTGGKKLTVQVIEVREGPTYLVSMEWWPRQGSGVDALCASLNGSLTSLRRMTKFPEGADPEGRRNSGVG